MALFLPNLVNKTLDFFRFFEISDLGVEPLDLFKDEDRTLDGISTIASHFFRRGETHRRIQFGKASARIDRAKISESQTHMELGVFPILRYQTLKNLDPLFVPILEFGFGRIGLPIAVKHDLVDPDLAAQLFIGLMVQCGPKFLFGGREFPQKIEGISKVIVECGIAIVKGNGLGEFSLGLGQILLAEGFSAFLIEMVGDDPTTLQGKE